MKPIRVAFVCLPRLLSNILEEAISEHDEIQFSGCYSETELEQRLEAVASDVLIWGVNGVSALPELSRRILGFNPDISIVALAEDGKVGTLWKIKFCSTPIGEIFPKKLVDTISALQVNTN